MKKIALLIALLLCVCVVSSCGYYSAPRQVYEDNPLSIPAEARFYRDIVSEIDCIEVSSGFVLWAAVVKSNSAVGVDETVVLQEMRVTDGKYSVGNHTRSFDLSSPGEKSVLNGDAFREADVGDGKSVYYTVWRTDALPEDISPATERKDYTATVNNEAVELSILYYFKNA